MRKGGITFGWSATALGSGLPEIEQRGVLSLPQPRGGLVRSSVLHRGALLSASLLALALFLAIPSRAALQQTPAGQGRGGGGIYPQTEPDDNAGFSPIFDGKTLTGWDGDPRYWRIENGEIVGETTPDIVVKENNFLIWRGGRLKDFELKVEFRMNGTNSGIQYRSAELPDIGKWVLKGYQADMDFTEGYVGNVHEERG